MPSLHFNGWCLAQAVVKADFLIKRNPTFPGLAFILQACDLLSTSSASNLRVIDNIGTTLGDFAVSTFSGRIGQGVALLLATRMGYSFVGHLASHPAVNRYERAADFLFETPSGDRMILESKGSFSLETNDPSKVKSVLKKALHEQVRPWLKRVAPPVSKGFATYTCIREESCVENSAIIFVDPPGSKSTEPFEISRSWVRRNNYAAWLAAMGLPAPANRLRHQVSGKEQRVEFWMTNFMGRKVLFRPIWCPIGRLYAIGIEEDALKAISAAIAGDERDLLSYQGITFEVEQLLTQSDNGNMMPDGIFLGRVPISKVIDGIYYNL